MEINIKEVVKQEVVFRYYREGQLWYSCEDGSNLFPVPISDTGTATFNARDKGILFMRYMRKWNNKLKGED